MKKKIISALFAGLALFCVSCDNVTELDVDFGDKTYVNDYSTLVDAVNNLNDSLYNRLDALNQLVENDMAQISIAVDKNTDAIVVLNSTTKEGLGAIDENILNGFTALKEQVDANGTKTVEAINNEGQLIALQIKESGELMAVKFLEAHNDNLVFDMVDKYTAAISPIIADKYIVDENSGLYKLLENAVTVAPYNAPEVVGLYYAKTAGAADYKTWANYQPESVGHNDCFILEDASDAPVYKLNFGTFTEGEYAETTKVTKQIVSKKYILSVSNICDYEKCLRIEVIDAKGTNVVYDKSETSPKFLSSGLENQPIEIVYSTGNASVAKPQIKVYCYNYN